MTLAFSWSTNTNYSTGPDSGTPTKVNPASTANGFISGVIAAPQHINFLFDAVGDVVAQAVDGVNGGTYTLGSVLRFEGADVEIAGDLEIVAGGEINVRSTAEINVLSGAQIDLAGDLNILSGGDIIGAAGAGILLDDSEDLTINANTENWILTLTPQAIALDGAGVPTWWPIIPPCAGFVQVDVASARQICFPINLPPGDSVSTIVVTLNGSGAGGGHAAIPAGGDRLLVSLVGVAFDGVVTTLATRADQSPNAGAYDISHVITLSSGTLDSGSLPRVLNALERYYVMISGETGADAEVATTVVTEVKGTCVARAYRSSTMVY